MPENENVPARESSAIDLLQKFATPIAIVIAGIFIAGAVYMSGVGKSAATQQQQGQPVQQAVDIKDVKITGEDPYIGNKNAPATMAYWSDYQCPFCKAFEVGGVPQIPNPEVMPTLIKKYVDTGKLKVVFKDYPFLGNDSTTAALYEHAIWESNPDKFYQWRVAMFKAQDEEGDQGFGDEASILALIKTIPGLDANALKALVAKNKDKYTKLIQDDLSEGSSFGISGTPGFITGKTLIAGFDQLSAFTSAIDAQLK